MSTVELMEKIKALPADKQREVEIFIQGLTQKDKAITVSENKSFDTATDSVFSKHEKLFRELAK